MKILQITDVATSAITRLAKQIIKHNKDIEIKLLPFHPKKPDKKEIETLKTEWEKADLIDIQYWKSGEKVKELMSDKWHKKKKILTHYNPYNLKEKEWTDYKVVCVVNNFQKSVLPNARLMPLAIDLDFNKFNRSNYVTDYIVNMCVNRIEGKKGVLTVAQACNDLNYKFILVGRISDGEYMNRVKKAAGSNLDFRQSVTDDEVRKGYYESAIHVCNSVDNFESGTMPVLEAMACGTPVLSRPVGHIPDIYNGKNMELFEKDNEDLNSLKEVLKNLMSDRRKRCEMRIEAEKSVQSRSDKVRANQYKELYKEVLA
jgi:glycosyltransferase involved in cell wall biosynthesis